MTTVVDRLRDGPPKDGPVGWLMTVGVTVVAFLIRLWHLGQPSAVMFDESAYAKDAFSLYQFGYEGTWGDASVVDPAVVHGDTSSLTAVGSFVSHPEVGKWLIGAGEALFGMNPFGWRFASLIFGTLLVFVVIRLGRRLSRSTMVGCLAGLFIAVDGLSFVMSRIAMLDIFQVFFIVAGVATVIADRDYYRQKLADALERTPNTSFDGQRGPFVIRPWLVVAGVMFGLACATKWNAVFPLVVFAVLSLVWSVSARRLAGAGRAKWWSFLFDGAQAFVSLVVLPIALYIVTWAGWLLTAGGYDRQWGAVNPDNWAVRHFGSALGSLWHYTQAMYAWHTGAAMASINHPYASNPIGWPVVARTIGVYAETDIPSGTQDCAAPAGETCMRVVTGLGTPLLWWGATAALVFGLVWCVIRRDWRWLVVILATCATWVPWFFAGRGSLFSYYALTMIPFMAIGLAMALDTFVKALKPDRRRLGILLVVVFVVLVIADFAFNYPIYTGQMLPTSHWLWRMWFPGWI